MNALPPSLPLSLCAASSVSPPFCFSAGDPFHREREERDQKWGAVMGRRAEE